jgi:conjugative relaxase-like TrwC/TraI family protein
MITCATISNGANYLGGHLRKNDYWSQGEQMDGYWFGKTAQMLGLRGVVEDAAFEALRINRDPRTFDPASGKGDKLTPRDKADRCAFTDIQLSAPKDVSVLAILGNDERVVSAFRESVQVALGELERFGAVRQRVGDDAHSEKRRRTGNICTAVFHHDASRDLDPQLHAHAVTANVTWDSVKQRFMALTPSEMMRASPYVRQVLYQELAKRLGELGYETHSHNENGFEVHGVEHLRERFSKRSATVARLALKFEHGSGRPPSASELNDWMEILIRSGYTREESEMAFEHGMGRPPSAGEIALLVKQSRADKLTEITTPEVRARQQTELTEKERGELAALVAAARGGSSPPTFATIPASEALEKALSHVFERKSVVHEGELLASALALAGGFVDAKALNEAIEKHPDVLRRELELTLRSIIEEERFILEVARAGKNNYSALGTGSVVCEQIGEEFTDQRTAGLAIAAGGDRISILIGDAGTGKTFLLKAVQAAHLAKGGKPWVALGPTGRVRDDLKKEGFSSSTIQRFLVDEGFQANAKGKVLLVDEAGMLSTPQMAKLFRIAEANGNRVLLVGDTKQHESVERGNALRLLIDEANVPAARLSTVKRQRSVEHKRLSEMLAAGRLAEGFDFAKSLGMVIEEKAEKTLIERAAAVYEQAMVEGREIIAVCPVWSEIDEFNAEVRTRLQERGIVAREEIERLGIVSKSWTEAEKAAWHRYRPGMILTFHKDTATWKNGDSAVVLAVEKNGLVVQEASGGTVKVTRKQSAAFDVSEAKPLAFAPGDKVLFRANCKRVGNTGEVATIKAVDRETGALWLTNGKKVPGKFAQICHGYAVTSHKAQGASVEGSLLIVGPKALAVANAEQWYVSNTRYRMEHTIFVANEKLLRQKLAAKSRRRQSATDFARRPQSPTPVAGKGNIPRAKSNRLGGITQSAQVVAQKVIAQVQRRLRILKYRATEVMRKQSHGYSANSSPRSR